MKKTVAIVLSIAVLAALLVCVFVACDNKDEAVIKSYQPIETKTYAIGDKYSSSDVSVVADLEDGTTRKIENKLVFVGEDALPLDDDDCFTAAGEYKIKVYALEERKDLYIGEWTIKVA